MIKPTLITLAPDAPGLIQACKDYINFIDSSKYHSDKEDDYTHAIFEAALEAVFGKNVFDFVNWKSDERDREYVAEQNAAALAEAKKLAESMGLKIVPKGKE